MKFRIIRNVPADSVAARVPRQFRDLLPPRAKLAPETTLIVFRARRDAPKSSAVVLSSDLASALSQLGNPERRHVLALAGDFTLEARSALKAIGGMAIGQRDFGWTDESYRRICDKYP